MSRKIWNVKRTFDIISRVILYFTIIHLFTFLSKEGCFHQTVGLCSMIRDKGLEFDIIHYWS